MFLFRFTPALAVLAVLALLPAAANAVPAKSTATAPVAKPAKTAMIATPRHAASTPAGRMVTTKTTTGKTITYNCALAGNASKKACK